MSDVVFRKSFSPFTSSSFLFQIPTRRSRRSQDLVGHRLGQRTIPGSTGRRPSLLFATLSSSRSVVLSCGIVPSHIPNLTTYGLPIFLPIDHTKSHVASPPFQAPTRQSKTKVESREQFPIRNPISHCASTPPCRFSHLPSQVFSADLVYFCVKRSPAPNLQTKSHVAPPRHVSRHVNRQLFPRATYFAPCHKSFAEAFVIPTSQ